MMSKAVIYARQSSGSDDYSDSVENQIANCRLLAEKENLQVIGCFSDLNTSGKTYPEGAEAIAGNDRAFQLWFRQQTGTKKFRPGLGRVFELLGETDFIIVDEMTRLYRPVTRSFLESFVNQRLSENQVQILQCKGGKLDLRQFDQQLIQTLKNQIQDEAIANQKKKSREQFRKLRDAGYQCNGAKMFGIRYLGGKKIEVIPECAEVIRFIYENIADCRPYCAIIREVNAKYGDRFRRGRCYESTFRSIARQPIYCGYQYDSRGELIRNVQIAGQEIIPYELWHRVATLMNERRKEPPVRAKKHWLPMSGRLICGGCGRRLTCQIDRGVIYYICNKTNLLHDPDCSASRIRFSGGDWNCLYETVYPLLLIALEERYRKNELLSRQTERRENLQHRIDRMLEKEEHLCHLYMEGALGSAQLDSLLNEYREERRQLQAKLRLSRLAAARGSEEDLSHRFSDLFVRIRDRELEQSEYEHLFRETVRRVVIRGDRVDFETTAGNLSLPRFQENRRKILPLWEIFLPEGVLETAPFRSGPKVKIRFLVGEPHVLLETEHLLFRTE